MTECPYCGTRLRKRAPKLERHDGELTAREGMRDRRRRRVAERRSASSRPSPAAGRPFATIAAIAAPALLLIVQRAANLSLLEVGAIIGPVDGEWWRYLAAPFVYDDLGYLFAIGLALAIFLPTVERRLGLVGALLMVVACGALGALAAVGMESALGDAIPVAAGGNGIALGVLGAWLALRDADRRQDPTDSYDQVAVAVAAAVLLGLPLVEDLASPWAGLAGGLVGLACGFAAALVGRAPAR